MILPNKNNELDSLFLLGVFSKNPQNRGGFIEIFVY